MAWINRSHRAGRLFAVAALCLAGMASAAAAMPAADDPAHPARTQGWVESRLYFGLGLVDAPAAEREQMWQGFLDQTVTPRFPAGLTVQDAYGQWQGPGQSAPKRLRSKLVIIDYADTPEHRRAIEQIRAAWKAKTGDRSVLRVTVPAEVSF